MQEHCSQFISFVIHSENRKIFKYLKGKSLNEGISVPEISENYFIQKYFFSKIRLF